MAALSFQIPEHLTHTKVKLTQAPFSTKDTRETAICIVVQIPEYWGPGILRPTQVPISRGTGEMVICLVDQIPEHRTHSKLKLIQAPFS